MCVLFVDLIIAIALRQTLHIEWIMNSKFRLPLMQREISSYKGDHTEWAHFLFNVGLFFAKFTSMLYRNYRYDVPFSFMQSQLMDFLVFRGKGFSEIT